MKTRPSPHHLGAVAERDALRYLQRRGLTLITRNYRTRFGEIDLIMQHGHVVVFVEVRYRKNDDFGRAAETITRGKKRRIAAAAEQFLMSHSRRGNPTARFDVVTINAADSHRPVEWFQNAFAAD